MIDRIPQQKTAHTTLAWVATLTAALFFFYEFIQMNLFNTINAELRQAFHLNAVELGHLFSMYFYANFACLFAAGNLLDRYSARKLLIFAVSICTMGTFLFSLADTYSMAVIGRLMVGAGASFCFLSCIRIASRWFPPQRMAFVTGVIVTLAMLGGLIAQTPFALLIKMTGSFKSALLVNSFLGVIILLLICLFVQDRPKDAQEEIKLDQDKLKEIGLLGSIKLAALNPQNWLGGLYTSFMNLPVFILGGLWGILYLTGVHQLNEVEASYATTCFFVGVIFGSLAYGWISDYLQKRVLPMVVGAIISLIIMFILMYVPNLTLTHLIILFFLIGFTTSSQVLTYPLIAELNPTYLTSTAISIDSLLIMSSGFIIPPFFGWLMEVHGTHQIVNNVAIYTKEHFQYAMWIMPISFIISLLITFFMKETRCQQQT